MEVLCHILKIHLEISMATIREAACVHTPPGYYSGEKGKSYITQVSVTDSCKMIFYYKNKNK